MLKQQHLEATFFKAGGCAIMWTKVGASALENKALVRALTFSPFSNPGRSRGERDYPNMRSVTQFDAKNKAGVP